MGNVKTTEKIDKDLCRLITPEFRVSYPHIFKPQAPNPTDKPKFSITMLFPKNQDLMGKTPDGKPRTLQEAIRNAKIAEFGDKSLWPKDLKSPVSDGDDASRFADKEGYKGCWIIKASSNQDQRPTVVGRDMGIITDPNEIYPGCFARAYVFARYWKHPMNGHGIHFILDHVQKVRDGKSFAGKKPVEAVFSPIEDDAVAVEDTASFDE